MLKPPPGSYRAAAGVIAATAFVAITYDVLTQGPLTALDGRAFVSLATLHASWVETAMRWVSLSGGPSATGAYAAVLIIACALRRRVAYGLGAAVYGGNLLNFALKHLLHRSRPVPVDPTLALSSFSYPSGHAMASCVFSGLICFWVVRSQVPRPVAAVGVGLAIAWCLLVAFSRVYLGLHYPTDVLAGLCEGVCWLAMTSAVLDRFQIDPMGRARA